MIKIMIDLLPYLFVAISANIILGTFYSIKTLKNKFSKTKLLEGLWKSFVISYGFITTSLVIDKIISIVDIKEFEFLPDALLVSAIVLYTGKAIKSLANILQVSKVIEKPVEDVEVIER